MQSLKKLLRKFAKINPNLAFFLKKKFYFSTPGNLDSIGIKNHQKNFFLLIPINGKIIGFATGPLNDQRGIGRFTRNLLHNILNEFNFDKELEKLTLSKKKELSDYNLSCVDIFFYSSMHWCNYQITENSIIMIMDVIPLVMRDFFPEAVIRSWETEFKKNAQKCRGIITISESSAKDICNYLRVKSEKIYVVSPGIEKIRFNEKVKVKIPTKPFVVFLGANDFHKNVEVLIEALTLPILREVSSVFIGENEELKKKCANLGLKDRVFFLGRLPDEQIAFIFRHSSLLVFPSLCEGFGLPPFEAAMYGVPSICSKRPAMTEVLHNCALFADPNDPQDWAVKIVQLLEDTDLRERIIKNARIKAENLTWKNCTKNILKILKENAF